MSREGEGKAGQAAAAMHVRVLSSTQGEQGELGTLGETDQTYVTGDTSEMHGRDMERRSHKVGCGAQNQTL